MLANLDVRALSALREKIEEELNEYVTDLECVGNWDGFVGHRERFRTFKEVLILMDEVQKALSE